jgi:hypothetical protein
MKEEEEFLISLDEEEIMREIEQLSQSSTLT